MLSASEYFASYEEEFLSIIQGIERLVLRCVGVEEEGGGGRMTQEEVLVLERRFYDAKKCLDQLRDEVSLVNR